MAPKGAINLTVNLVGTADLSAVLRELNALNDFFTSAEARKSGTPIQPPRITRSLDSLARENQYNLLDKASRQAMMSQLDSVRHNAPRVHISFASEPSPKAMEKLVIWFRTSVHPQMLMQVGLQPNIAAGCVVRTPNKFFDMSLRAHLEKQENYLVELTKGALNGRK